MLCFPLLLAGIPMSTCFIGESVSQKAIVGMLPRADSLIGCKKYQKMKLATNLLPKQQKYSKVIHLMVCPWIGKNEQARFAEGCLKLIGKCSRSVPPGNRMGTGILGKFQHSSLTVRPGRLNNDILGILNCHNHSSCKLKLFPSFPKIDDENTLQ